MPKIAYFLEKGCKIAAAPGGLRPRTPLAFGGWGLRPPPCYSHLNIDLSKYVFIVNLFY